MSIYVKKRYYNKPSDKVLLIERWKNMSNTKFVTAEAKENEIMESTTDFIHLFITSLLSCKEKHEIGDILENEESEDRFALVARVNASDKLNPNAVRLSLKRLFKKFDTENRKYPTTIIMNNFQFHTNKEKIDFYCILSELLMDKDVPDIVLLITNADNQVSKKSEEK